MRVHAGCVVNKSIENSYEIISVYIDRVVVVFYLHFFNSKSGVHYTWLTVKKERDYLEAVCKDQDVINIDVLLKRPSFVLTKSGLRTESVSIVMFRIH